VRRLEDGDTTSTVLAEFLGILDGPGVGVTAVYLDREFYDSKCLTLLQSHNYAYVLLFVRWGKTIKQELSGGWSSVIQHSLTTTLNGHSWTDKFPVYINCTYQNGTVKILILITLRTLSCRSLLYRAPFLVVRTRHLVLLTVIAQILQTVLIVRQKDLIDAL